MVRENNPKIQEYLYNKWHIVSNDKNSITFRRYKLYWGWFIFLMFFGGLGIIYVIILLIINRKKVTLKKYI